MMENIFNNINLLKNIWKWKFHIISISVIAAIFAIIFSSPFFIKPKFKSSVILYPSNLKAYSEETNTEQFLQWLESNVIKDSIINKYNLYEHYEVDTANKYAYSLVRNIFNSNVSIDRTKFESVEITVYDTDPLMAFNIVNDIIYYYDELVEQQEKEKIQEIIDYTEIEFNRTKKELDTLSIRMHEFNKKFGIIDVQAQMEQIIKGYLNTIDGNNPFVNKEEIKKLKSIIEEKLTSYTYIDARYKQILFQHLEYWTSLNILYRDIKKEITYYSIVTKPFIADKKVSPKRSIILFFTVLSTFLISTFVLAFLNKE